MVVDTGWIFGQCTSWLWWYKNTIRRSSGSVSQTGKQFHPIWSRWSSRLENLQSYPVTRTRPNNAFVQYVLIWFLGKLRSKKNIVRAKKTVGKKRLLFPLFSNYDIRSMWLLLVRGRTSAIPLIGPAIFYIIDLAHVWRHQRLMSTRV